MSSATFLLIFSGAVCICLSYGCSDVSKVLGDEKQEDRGKTYTAEKNKEVLLSIRDFKKLLQNPNL